MEQSQPPTASKPETNRRLRLAALLVVVILIVVVIGSIFMFNLGSQQETPHVTGAFVGTPQSPTDGYQLTFGVVVPTVKFTDCRVALSINGTWQIAQTINVTGGNAFTANNISWIDLANDGIISSGDRLVVSDPVSTVTYDVAIIFAPGGNTICHQSWTVL